MSLPAIGLDKSIHTPVGTGRYDLNSFEDTFTNISKYSVTRYDDDRTLCSWFRLRNLHLDNQENSEFMNGGARIVLEEDRVVPEKVRLGVKHRKTRDIGPGLDAEASHFRLMLNRAIEAETTWEKPIGEIT